jgi:hypothetical protein
MQIVKKHKSNLGSNTPEFWIILQQGNLVAVMVLTAHIQAATVGHPRKCAIATAIRALSPLVYDIRVDKKGIFVWLLLDGKRWRYRFLLTDSSRPFAQRFDKGMKDPKDTKVTMSYDTKWEIKDREYVPRSFPYTILSSPSTAPSTADISIDINAPNGELSTGDIGVATSAVLEAGRATTEQTAMPDSDVLEAERERLEDERLRQTADSEEAEHQTATADQPDAAEDVGDPEAAVYADESDAAEDVGDQGAAPDVARSSSDTTRTVFEQHIFKESTTPVVPPEAVPAVMAQQVRRSRSAQRPSRWD